MSCEAAEYAFNTGFCGGIWKPVPRFPNIEASSFGEIRNVGGKIRKQSVSAYGYFVITVKPTIVKAVHLLVASAFIGKCPPGLQCRHLDGDRTNNRSSNLEYGTQTDNEHDKRLHGRIPMNEKHWNAKLTKDDISRMKKKYRKGARGGAHCAKAVSAEFGIGPRYLREIVNSRRTWKNVL